MNLKVNDTMVLDGGRILGSGPRFGSVLAYVDGGPGSEAVIQTAARIGQVHSCYVEVLHVAQAVDTSLLALDAGSGMAASAEIFRIMQDDARKRETAARTAFEEFCNNADVVTVDPDSRETLANEGFTIAWNLVSGTAGRDLAHRGRLFDLIIMARASDQIGGIDSIQLESALFDSGRPVLVTAGGAVESEPGAVVIAWDGSREAAHSVALAMPLLSNASKVYVMSVGERDPGMEIEDLSRYLARHGITAELCHLSKSDKSVAHVLVDASFNKNVHLLVMGAYGHSAIGESLFGGVTRDMLEAGKIPLLLAH
ncbi:MAG: universal stress protein [Rhodospirillales bacterium]|nr:universal stress protein [Rhodospirillales bacterium]